MTSITEKLKCSTSSFEHFRYKYKLCSSETGFFQPFRSLSDVHQQFKTTLISPVIGLFSVAENILRLIQSVLTMAMSIPCISPDLFIEGFNDSLAAITSIIVTPLFAISVTLASLISMGTRTLATVFSCCDSESKDIHITVQNTENPITNKFF